MANNGVCIGVCNKHQTYLTLSSQFIFFCPMLILLVFVEAQM